jgi:NAD(P)H-flavin reductase
MSILSPLIKSIVKIIHCDITTFMKKADGYLSKIWQDGKAACFEFQTSTNISIQSGQFLMTRGREDILSVPVYPIDVENRLFTSMNSAGNHWRVGDEISISGPQGKGFAIPSVSHRLLMVSSTSTPLRLLPVAISLISRGGEAALFSGTVPEHLPGEVELLSRDQLGDALDWADCIIGDARLKGLTKWMGLFSGQKNSPLGRGVQLLIDTPLVCAGVSECGVCAVKTKHGWKQACSDGPVFLLDELEIP